MSTPSDDGSESELSKYAPKWSREQPTAPDVERPRYVSSSASTGRPLNVERQGRQITNLWPEPVPEPPAREGGLLAFMGSSVKVAAFAALVALLAVFGKSLFVDVSSSLNSDSQAKQVSKPSDRLTANEVPANSALAPAPAIAAAPGAASSTNAQAAQPPSAAPGQQAALSPIAKTPGQESSVSSLVRGVTDTEIRFGISAPFTGPAKELGQHMKQGIEAAFSVANAKGGVYGRQLRLIAVDDGYEPTRTAAAMKQLYERDQVFGLVGNVGTPTAVVALPYALDR